mgnify:CR=1 FL=1
MKKHRKILKTLLKEVRIEHQLLQKDICEASMLSQGYISRLENGNRLLNTSLKSNSRGLRA